MTSDVLIVGGGIIGAALAWRLAARGVFVRIVEAGAWGGEASWAGAGMLAPGGEVESEGRGAALCLRGREVYPAFVRELTEVSGVAIDLRLSGAVELAANDAELESLAARATAQARLGIPAVTMNAAALVELAPGVDAGKWAGGLHYPCDGLVDPRDVMAALRTAIEKAGAAVHTGLRVETIRLRSGRAEAVTAAGTYSAEVAVIAAGAWSSMISIDPPASLPRAYPVRGHLIRYDRPPGEIAPIVRHGHTYLLQRSNGSLIAGTSQEEVGFDREIDAQRAAGIHMRAEQLVPALSGALPVETWTGFRPAAEGGEPVMGSLDGGPLWLAYGHFRNGILMAPAVAEELSGAIIASLGKG